MTRTSGRDSREDDSRGRHTTTRRELIVLPDGGIVVDTPGMRELQLWSDEDGLKRAFDDVETLAEQCRFRDCGHTNEPGCALIEACSQGDLNESRLENFRHMAQNLK